MIKLNLWYTASTNVQLIKKSLHDHLHQHQSPWCNKTNRKLQILLRSSQIWCRSVLTAMVMTVLPANALVAAASNDFSVPGSTELVASSITRQAASWSIARARQNNWRSPALRLLPPSRTSASERTPEFRPVVHYRRLTHSPATTLSTRRQFTQLSLFNEMWYSTSKDVRKT